MISSIQDIKRQKKVDDIWESMKLEEKNEPKKDTVARKRSLKKANKKGNRKAKQVGHTFVLFPMVLIIMLLIMLIC
jgi:hypothetical protein